MIALVLYFVLFVCLPKVTYRTSAQEWHTQYSILFELKRLILNLRKLRCLEFVGQNIKVKSAQTFALEFLYVALNTKLYVQGQNLGDWSKNTDWLQNNSLWDEQLLKFTNIWETFKFWSTKRRDLFEHLKHSIKHQKKAKTLRVGINHPGVKAALLTRYKAKHKRSKASASKLYAYLQTQNLLKNTKKSSINLSAESRRHIGDNGISHGAFKTGIKYAQGLKKNKPNKNLVILKDQWRIFQSRYIYTENKTFT